VKFLERQPGWLQQLVRFGLVGILATAVNALLYLFLAQHHLLRPVLANAVGFLCAFALSFGGHYYWTFAAQTRNGGAWHASLVRFFATALLGLGSNTLWTWLLVEQLRLPPASALAGILFITPVLVFVCSKYWAFAQPGS
jgi:putative flippase GtrA